MNAVWDVFETILLQGFGVMDGAALDLYKFIIWALCFSLILNYLANSRQVNASQPIALIILVIIIGTIVSYWQKWSELFVETMWSLGLEITGGPISMVDFKDFDAMLIKGLSMAGPALASIQDLGWLGFYNSFSVIIPTLILAFILVAVNAYLAFQLFRSMLLFTILSMIAMVAMTTAVWNKSAWIAEGALRYTIGMGIGILALSIGASITFGVADSIQVNPEAPFSTLLVLTAAVTAAIMLAVGAQSMVQSYFNGTPDLHSGAGSALRSTMVTVSNIRTLASLRAISAARSAALPSPPNAGSLPPTGGASNPGGSFRTTNNAGSRTYGRTTVRRRP